MTEEAWTAELVDCCQATAWVIEHSGITRIGHLCIAQLRHATTHDIMQVSLAERFETRGARCREILRQLGQ
jgi:hypothetical protein